MGGNAIRQEREHRKTSRFGGDKNEGYRLGHVESEAGGEGSYSPRMC